LPQPKFQLFGLFLVLLDATFKAINLMFKRVDLAFIASDVSKRLFVSPNQSVIVHFPPPAASALPDSGLAIQSRAKTIDAASLKHHSGSTPTIAAKDSI
jgi:hypothetical protein